MSEQERREAMDRRQKVVAQSSDQGLRQNPLQLGPPQQCPRCESFNTKFCYYNNYSLSQPRFFCKACRRYWTRGGTLRNVPVGGGCRKTKRSKPSSPSSSGESPPSRQLPPPQPSFGSESIATSPGISSLTPPSRPSPPPGSLASPPMSTFFSGVGGFLPLGFINSPLITQADVSASKSIRGSSSASNITTGDLGLLQGFELPSFGFQRQLQTSDGGGLVSVPASTRPENGNGWPLSFNTAASSSANLSLNHTAGSDAVGFWSVANSGDAGVSGGA